MKLKIKAVANDIDSIEKLINDYFYSKFYYIDLENNRSGKMSFIIKSRKNTIPDYINESYKVKLRKGKYYFYRVLEDEEKEGWIRKWTSNV